jgi:membrane-associated phospholipid phosphatase
VTDVSDHDQMTAPGEDLASLGDISHRRQVRLAGIHLSGRRRRPSGEKPPLPRQLKLSGWFWLLAGIALSVLWLSLFAFPATTTFWAQVDHAVLNWFVDVRTDAATSVMESLQLLGSLWLIRPLRWTTLIILAVFRRWRVFFGVLLAFVIVDTMQRTLSNAIARPRPLVEIIGEWAGYSHPSKPVALLAVTVVVVGLALIPRGRWRTAWLAGTTVIVALLAVSLLYLGTDHPSDVAVGWLIGPVVGVLIFRWIAPESVYPVSYGKGRTAHLDVTGTRGRAIRTGSMPSAGVGGGKPRGPRIPRRPGSTSVPENGSSAPCRGFRESPGRPRRNASSRPLKSQSP